MKCSIRWLFSFAPSGLAFCALFAPLAAQSQILITSGSAATSNQFGPPVGVGSINLSGDGFSLSSTLLITTASGGARGAGPSLADVGFSATTTANAANSSPGILGSVSYQGIKYALVGINLSFVASPLTVTTNIDQYFNYSASVSNLPFSMTGKIMVCITTQPPGDITCSQPSQTLTISGSGIYSAHVRGNLFSGGSLPTASGTYQFAGPSGFVRDTTTQGNWNGTYGGDGYLIANGANYAPPYAAVGFMPNNPYTWVGPGQIDDVRALQNSTCFQTDDAQGSCITATRIASAFTWYGTNSVNISLTFTDDAVHRVALYLLDWDTTGRQEKVTIEQNGVLLDTETFSNFYNGQYGAWTLQGNVLITVTPIGPASATNPGSPVVSGIFFGPGSKNTLPPLPPNARPTASAIFHGYDSQTEGNWNGNYGTDGYLIANGSSQLPAYATVNVAGDLPYTWALGTSDLRALQTSPGASSRIASAFTQFGSQDLTFHLHVTDAFSLTSLYLLDWDSTGRQETVTIKDTATGVVLDAQTVSGFHNGGYLTWNINGDVTVTVTPVGVSSQTNPGNAVVSGIFFTSEPGFASPQ